MIIINGKKSSPCDKYQGILEEKVAELAEQGKPIPDDLMTCYESSPKLKETKEESIL